MRSRRCMSHCASASGPSAKRREDRQADGALCVDLRFGEPSHVRAAFLSAPRFLPPSYLGETHEGCSQPHAAGLRPHSYFRPETSGNGGRVGQACTHLVRYRPVAADGMRECVRHVIVVHRAGGETVVTVCRNSASVAVAHIQVHRSRCARLIFACTRTLPLAVVVLGAWWVTRSAADEMGVEQHGAQEMPN
jgi:hypothetical protein